MTEEVKPEVIKRTQSLLGKYIKKPPLTEKLLKKPPFKFLHDIITSIIRETSFLEGLFTVAEMNHENIRDKDGKIAFLQKLIDAMKAITNLPITARPSKIVAGHEASKTNELLQAIGKALDKKINSVEYVKSLKKGVKKGKSVPDTSVSKQKPTPKKETVSAESKTGAKPKASLVKTLKDKVNPKEKVSENKKSISKPRVQDNTKLGNEKVQPEKEEEIKMVETEDIFGSREAMPEVAAQPMTAALEMPNVLVEAAANVEQQQMHEEQLITERASVSAGKPLELTMKRPQSARVRKPSASIAEREPLVMAPRNSTPTSPSDVAEKVERPSTARTSARPPSARPAAPRIRDRGEVVLPKEPVTTVNKVHVITDKDVLREMEEDDVDAFVVMEKPSSPTLLDDREVEQQPLDGTRRGHLVSQILQTQKELEEKHNGPDGKTPTEIEWETGQKRDTADMERLRLSIQTLTRAANPLGKLMDYLHEDVDSMQQELNKWKVTNVELAQQLKQGRSLTDQCIEAMTRKLTEIQESIDDQIDMNCVVKTNIYRQNERLEQLLTARYSGLPSEVRPAT